MKPTHTANMGLEGLQEELDFLTGRYTMRRRPAHGRLFTTPLTHRPHGPLDDMTVSGKRMKVPDTPRSYPSYGSESRTPATGSSSSMTVTADIGEGLHRKRHDEAQTRRLQRKSYSTPLYDPESLRRSRTVRFEAPRTASNTPQPIILPEQIEVPQPVWEDETTTLEGELFDFQPEHASEHLEQVVVVRVREKTGSSDSTLEPVITNEQPTRWLEEIAKKRKTPSQEPVQVVPPPEIEDTSKDCKYVAM